MSKVGSVFGVSTEVVAWDAVGADVELSCAAMFSREAGGAEVIGGLAHLNAAFHGQLLELRSEGAFTAAAGECLLIPTPPRGINAKKLLIVGLGEPDGWSVENLSQAIRSAAEFAMALGVRSAAFAPGMLDSGIAPSTTAGASTFMVDGLTAALRARARLVDLGFAEKPLLERWVFDVGAARLASATAQFQERIQQQTA